MKCGLCLVFILLFLNHILTLVMPYHKVNLNNATGYFLNNEHLYKGTVLVIALLLFIVKIVGIFLFNFNSLMYILY
jgi:hypothetical protein